MSFDRLAPHYRWMEAMLAGELLQRVRTRWLPDVANSRHVLLAGEGHGRMLAACVTAMPAAHFTVVDESRLMLQAAERSWGRTGRQGAVIFQQADLRDPFSGAEKFDLIVTNFFLDCFAPEELAVVIKNLAAAAAGQANWLVADFWVPPQGWRRFRARMVLGLAYFFFRRATQISARSITPPDAIMKGLGFNLRGRERFNFDLLQAEFWSRP